MRLTRPDRGVTLIELVIAMVVMAIIASIAIYFLYPVRQAGDLATRAELTDIADNALQRIGREARLALPNSVRVSDGGTTLEFLAVRAAGRYRADIGGAAAGTNCPSDTGLTAPGDDQLSFDVADTCFKSIGEVYNGGTVVAGDFLVLNNYGAVTSPSVEFSGQNAYQSGAANRVAIASSTVEAGPPVRLRLSYGSKTFQRTLHDSPGKRFFVISGPVTYRCSGGQLTRHSGYTIAESPTLPAGSLIADNVSSCSFDYESSAVAPLVGLLTVRLTLSKALSGGASETVRLYHAVHVNNVP
jgi:MSHA biogenesis protein MshO